MFATSIVYFLSMDGVVVMPSTLAPLDIAQLQTLVTFKNANNEDYELLDPTTVKLYRYRVHFSALTTTAIRNTELVTIKMKLQAAWRTKIGRLCLA